jgi:hypothetical protein
LLYDNELFVVEGATVFVYSIKDLSLTRKFGRKGEGPGELKIIPFKFNILNVFSDYILFDGFDKVVFYSKDGTFIKEKKKDSLHFIVQPVGDNFVTYTIKRNMNGVRYSTISLCTTGLKVIKELYRQKYPDQNRVLDMYPDSINFAIYENKIFIDESPKGFFIQVYDSKGGELYHINKDYEKIKVMNQHKKVAVDRLAEDPEVKAAGGWENIGKLVKLNFPGFFPAIREMDVVEGKIFVKTFKTQDNKDEFIIMDLKGKILKKVFLPGAYSILADDEITGRINRFYSFSKDRYFYLIENEKDEVWETHIEKIDLN